MGFKLSVIIPVYNEKGTIRQVIETIRSVPVEKEVVIVDDGSDDGTREVIRQYFENHDGCRVIFHDKNQGKGAAVRTGIQAASGDAIVIQDADLEYNPMDYLVLLDAMLKTGAGVVYGSRFLNKKKVTSGWHRFVNYFLTSLTNILYSAKLTDMETCYKLFRSNIIQSVCLKSKAFEIEVELTAKVLKMGERIVEVPISYKGRSFHEGKKIGWKDGVKAVLSLFRYRFSS